MLHNLSQSTLFPRENKNFNCTLYVQIALLPGNTPCVVCVFTYLPAMVNGGLINPHS